MHQDAPAPAWRRCVAAAVHRDDRQARLPFHRPGTGGGRNGRGSRNHWLLRAWNLARIPHDRCRRHYRRCDCGAARRADLRVCDGFGSRRRGDFVPAGAARHLCACSHRRRSRGQRRHCHGRIRISTVLVVDDGRRCRRRAFRGSFRQAARPRRVQPADRAIAGQHHWRTRGARYRCCSWIGRLDRQPRALDQGRRGSDRRLRGGCRPRRRSIGRPADAREPGLAAAPSRSIAPPTWSHSAACLANRISAGNAGGHISCWKAHSSREALSVRCKSRFAGAGLPRRRSAAACARGVWGGPAARSPTR